MMAAGAAVAIVAVAAGISEPQAGPRPNRDPEAVPDGRRPEQDRMTVAVSASIVSDYRFRGVTQSGGHSAVQGSLEVASPSGFYAGTWASTASVSSGSSIEVDLYGGYRVEAANLRLDGGVVSYHYPGARSSSSVELYASAARDVGTAEVKAGASYAPRQSTLRGEDGLYLFAEVESPLPVTSVRMRAHVGRERGANVESGTTKIDWLVGADYSVKPATISLAWLGARYNNTRVGAGSDRLVVSLSLDF